MNRGVPTFALLLVALIVASLPCIAQAKGGEIGQIPVLNLGGDFAGGNARQNICDRYEDFATGKTQLRDALSRMKLHALLMNDEFLSYTAKEGLSPEDPGIIAEIMDVLAERANFTWRDSFGVMEETSFSNKSWTERLIWSVENFDIAVSWYDHSLERMERGASFLENWYSGGSERPSCAQQCQSVELGKTL